MPINKNREDAKFYSKWSDMKNRCSSVTCRKYPLYGGRGIKVCDRWQSYNNFKEDMWDSYKIHCEEFSPRQTTLDRIDPNGNYEPSNCRWATYKEQRINVGNKAIYRGINLSTSEETIFNNCADFAIEHDLHVQSIFDSIRNNKDYKGWKFTRITKKERE